MDLCVVVDDGSTDNTVGVVEELTKSENRISLIHQKNSGVASARNTGLRMAGASPFVMFVDADDLLEPDSIRQLYQAVEEEPMATGAVGYARFITERGEREESDEPKLFTEVRQFYDAKTNRIVSDEQGGDITIQQLILRQHILAPGGALCLRETVERIGAFRTDCGPAAHWDLFIRLGWTGPFKYVPQPVLRYRRHSSNMSKAKYRMTRDVQRIGPRGLQICLDKHSGMSDTITPGFYRAAQCAWARHLAKERVAVCAKEYLKGRVLTGSKMGLLAARNVMHSCYWSVPWEYA